jgi:hypothetical protein
MSADLIYTRNNHLCCNFGDGHSWIFASIVLSCSLCLMYGIFYLLLSVKFLSFHDIIYMIGNTSVVSDVRFSLKCRW